MTPIKPFLIDAVRNWAVDNGLTPQLVVDASLPGVSVPRDFVDNDRIVLNVHPRAVHGYGVNGDCLVFSARFAGHSRALQIPLPAVRAVYARENRQGISFPEDAGKRSGLAGERPTDPDSPPSGSGPHLRVVK
jgi:stringent starvation protein B